MRDERLKDVVTDHGFLHISEIGAACDEINVYIENDPEPSALYDFQVIVKEFLENSCAGVALEPCAAWSKDMVRLYTVGETKGQMDSWVEITGSGRCSHSARELQYAFRCAKSIEFHTPGSGHPFLRSTWRISGL